MSEDMRDETLHVAPRRTRQAEASVSASALASELEVLATSDGKYTFDVKVRATGAKFRVSPTRDPRQPRLWCISVRQCSSVAMPDPSSPVWIDRPGAPWAEMPEAIEIVRADVAGWLAVPARGDLCRWLMSAPAAASPAMMVEAATERRRPVARVSR